MSDQDLSTGFPLVLSDRDIDSSDRAELEALARGEQVLGENPSLDERLGKVLSHIALKRLRDAIPSDFRIAEVSMGFSLGGKLLGVGIDGEMQVKLEPEVEEES